MTTQAPRPSVASRGPWADSMRRLRRNHMAVAGGLVVLVMGCLAIFAPWIVPFDPEVQERWTGSLEPGTRHLDLRNEIALDPGVRPADLNVPARVVDVLGDGREHEMQLSVQREKVTLLRVALEDGRVTQIGEGGKRHSRVEAGEGETLRIRGETAPIAATAITTGEPAPPGIPAPGGRSVAMVEKVTRTAQDRSEAVARFRGDGTIASLTVDGKPADARFVVQGKDVADVRLDGAQLTHVHRLGTDQEGRDTLSRVIYGGRISLLIGLVATCVGLTIGVVYGAVSGYAGGRTDTILMRTVDVLYALPYVFLVILLLVMFGRSIVILFVALGCVQWLTPARVVRGQVLSLKHREFVDAARMLGATGATILRRHLIPNTLGIVAVYMTLMIPTVILEESFLSFIGLRVEYDGRALESWGALVDYGRQSLGTNGERWWLLVCPAIAMSVTLFSLNFLGDGLRDALDPQQRGRK